MFNERAVNLILVRKDCKEMDKKTLNSRQLQASERRKQLLNAAKELFAEKGYHATSMREINGKVGMADGLTYHYFPKGKLEILHTIIHEGQEKLMGEVSEMILSFDYSISLSDALIKLSHHIVDSFIKDQALTQILFREKQLLDQDEAKFLNEVVKKHQQIFIDFLAGRANDGEIRHMDFELAASQFMSNILILAIQNMAGFHFFEDNVDTFIVRYVNFTSDLWSSK